MNKLHILALTVLMLIFSYNDAKAFIFDSKGKKDNEALENLNNHITENVQPRYENAEKLQERYSKSYADLEVCFSDIVKLEENYAKFSKDTLDESPEMVKSFISSLKTKDIDRIKQIQNKCKTIQFQQKQLEEEIDKIKGNPEQIYRELEKYKAEFTKEYNEFIKQRDYAWFNIVYQNKDKTAGKETERRYDKWFNEFLHNSRMDEWNKLINNNKINRYAEIQQNLKTIADLRNGISNFWTSMSQEVFKQYEITLDPDELDKGFVTLLDKLQKKCEHGIIADQCYICDPSLPCEHKIKYKECKICNPVKHTVTFLKIDGSVYKSYSIEEGDNVEIPDVPSLNDEYKFIGWSDTKGGKPYSFGSAITAPITLYPIYEILVSIYITEKDIRDKYIKPGLSLERPYNLILDGYRFSHFICNGVPFDFSTKIEKPIQIKAVWVKVFTVSFFDGDELLIEQKVDQGACPEVLANPVKKGYIFKNWTTGGTNVFDFKSPINSSIKVYAIYDKEPEEQPPTYVFCSEHKDVKLDEKGECSACIKEESKDPPQPRPEKNKYLQMLEDFINRVGFVNLLILDGILFLITIILSTLLIFKKSK
mgnify:CR=1 FL=1